jgi:hypothetical protein
MSWLPWAWTLLILMLWKKLQFGHAMHLSVASFSQQRPGVLDQVKSVWDLWWTKWYTHLNHKRNEENLEGLHVTPLEDKLRTYRHKWFQHVHRMEDNRLPKQLLNYDQKGRWQPRRPLKRLLDDMTAENETGHPGLNSWWNMMMMMTK